METDDELVARSRTGDVAAFARLVDLHQAVAHRVAAAVLGSGEESDDVVQEAFVRAFTRLHQLDDRPFRPWLVGIVANEARNRRRSRGRRDALVLRVAARAATAEDAADPSVFAEAHDAQRRLAAAVALLPERDREVVALRYFAELSEAETAAALGCPAGTVKSRLSRALGRLRSEMSGEEAV